MRRPLSAALSVVVALLVGVLGLSAPALADPPPAATTTTVVMSPAAAAIGDTVTLTATVTAAGDPVPVGYVNFDAALTEESLWGADTWDPPYPDATDVALGSAAVDANGVATFSVTLTAATITFLTAGTPFFLAAEYQPYELGGLGIYDTDYAVSTSAALPVTGPAPPVLPKTATTTSLTGPSEIFAGQETVWTVAVGPADIAGTAQVVVDGAPVATVPVAGGVATFRYTFTKPGAVQVAATFIPADETSYVRSADQRSVTVSQAMPAISLGYGASSVGDGGTYTVTADQDGTVTVFVGLPEGAKVGTLSATLDGDPQAAEVLATGISQLAWVHFPALTIGAHSLSVHYTSTAPAVASADATFTLRAAPRTFTAVNAVAVGDNNDKRVRVTVQVGAVDGTAPTGSVQLMSPTGIGSVGHAIGDRLPLVNGVATAVLPYESFRFVLGRDSYSYGVGADFEPEGSAFMDSRNAGIALTGLTWPAPAAATVTQVQSSVSPALVASQTAAIISTSVAVGIGDPHLGIGGSFASGTATRVDGPQARRAIAVEVECPPTETGYVCNFGLQPAGTYRITVTIPMPADSAGTSVPVTVSVTGSDPETGESTTLASTESTVKVPKRTVLAAGLAPVKDVSSVRPGAVSTYRASLKNVGIIDADDVEVCVSLSAGAELRAARGARMRGRSACWVLTHLDAEARTNRTVRFVAPEKPGDLRITLTVTPRPSQAAPVRLTAHLPVR